MHLLVKKDGKLLQRLDVKPNKPLILGRSKKCDLQLKDEKISRHHLKVSASNKGLIFEDLQSKNGTFFKNIRIKTKELFAQQSLKIGGYVLQVENVNTTEQNTMAMLEDDGATEVALASDDLEIFEEAHLEPTRAAQDPPSQAFMEAIAVSNQSPDAVDELSDQQDRSETFEVSQPFGDVWDEQQSFANAPEASIEDALDQALHSATFSEGQFDPALTEQAAPPTPEPPADADQQTEVANHSDSISDALDKPDASTSNFFFSSMDSSPNAQVDEIRDVFTATVKPSDAPASEAQEDSENDLDTGDFPAPPADSISSGQTEIRNFTVEPADQPDPSKPTQKRKPLFLFLVAIAVGMVLLFIDEKDALFNKAPTTPSSTKQTPSTPKSSAEDERLATHLIEETQAALDAQDLETAKAKMKILTETYAQTQSLQSFMPIYEQAKQAMEEQQALEAQQQEEQAQQINLLLAKGKKLVDQKEFEAAKETFEKILLIQPGHPESTDWLTKTEELSVQEEYKDFAKKRRHQELDRIYLQAVEAFEAGQFGKAKEFLRTVSQDRSHAKARSADKLLQQIATQTDSKLEQKIIQAKNKIASLSTLPEGYQELKTLTEQFPQRKDAQSYFQQAEDKMLEKAKQLYAEAIAQEELAGDYATALDLYQEVLTYAPDPNSQYHRKAKTRIDNLQL